MRYLVIILLLSSCSPTVKRYLQEHEVKPSKPIIKHGPIFFKDSTYVAISMTSLENNDNSNFEEKKYFYNSRVLKYQHSKAGFIPSDTVSISIFKVPSIPIDTIILNNSPSEKYSGRGSHSLKDYQKGGTNFRSDDWLGFNETSVNMKALFTEKQVSKIVISSLVHQGAWIFAPYRISVYSEEKLIKSKTFSSSIDQSSNNYFFIELSFEPLVTSTLDISIEALEALPYWHPGAGSKPWLFLDEILIF